MLIIMDNGQVHHCGKVSKLFNERDNMKRLFAPQHSPELNPKEYVHNFFLDKFPNNRNFKSIKHVGFIKDKIVENGLNCLTL